MDEKILKIGVTGSAGSGKSIVCQGFKRLGLVTLDCDLIARQVVEPGQKAYERVVSEFGADILARDLTLDRAKLRGMIVARPDLREQLEKILHPVIIEEMVLQMETGDYSMARSCAVEVPLLFELAMEKYFDVVVVVAAPDDQLVRRISARDRVDEESARKMLALQMPQEEKIRRADYVIHNQEDKSKVFQAVSLLYQKLVNQRLTKKK